MLLVVVWMRTERSFYFSYDEIKLLCYIIMNNTLHYEVIMLKLQVLFTTV